MKIQALLEGKIKVPTDAYNQLMIAVCTDIFSRIITYLNGPAGDEYFDNLLKFKELIKKYRKEFGHFDVYENYTANYATTHKLYVRMDEVDPRYLKRTQMQKVRYMQSTQLSPHPIVIGFHLADTTRSRGQRLLKLK